MSSFFSTVLDLTNHTPEIRNEAYKIVQELGCLPLAIEQAAAYIRTSRNIGEYLITYKKERQELLDWRSTGNYPYNYTVATTLRMSLERLKLSHPNAIALIQYLAFLNPDEILLDFLKDGIGALPSRIQVLIENSLRRVESLNALESFSLIRVFGEGRKISIHRLVQAVVQDDLDSSLQALIISDVIRLGLQSFPDIESDASQRETCRRYRSQAMACLRKGNSAKYGSEWHLLAACVAFYLNNDGFYKDCLHWWQLIFNIRTKVLGAEHPSTLLSMHGLATSYSNLGQIKKATRLQEETLEIQRRVLGPEHPDALRSMNNLASSYDSLGQSKEAAQLFEETLEIRKRVLGPEHPNTLWSMNGLATSYWGLGQIKKATRLQEETLEIQRRVLGPEHPDTLRSMNDLVSSYGSRGQNKEAARLVEETLEIRRRVLGPEHPDTLWSMNSLATSYLSLSQSKEAARLFKETLEIRKRALGPEHPDTLWSMNCLASSYHSLGQSKETARLFEEILEIRRRVLG